MGDATSVLGSIKWTVIRDVVYGASILILAYIFTPLLMYWVVLAASFCGTIFFLTLLAQLLGYKIRSTLERLKE